MSSSFDQITLNVMSQMRLLLTHSPAQAPAPRQVGIPLWIVITQRESSLIFSSPWSLAGRSLNSVGPSLRVWFISGWAQMDNSLCFCVQTTSCFFLKSSLVWSVFLLFQTAPIAAYFHHTVIAPHLYFPPLFNCYTVLLPHFLIYY